MIETSKVHSAGKVVVGRSQGLSDVVGKTLGLMSEVVGGTLGPGGRHVIIERREWAFPPLLTKDGVTVMRSLGFADPLQQTILETTRDAAIRTAVEAGDGTTTATILTEAFVRYTRAYCDQNPNSSPQAVARQLVALMGEHLLPALDKFAAETPVTPELLRQVALVAANGDEVLADAVIAAYDIAGDEGNVTLSEAVGSAGLEVEPIDGYSIGAGLENAAGRFAPKFMNDAGHGMAVIERPRAVCYHATVNEMATIKALEALLAKTPDEQNLVLFAIGFSEPVIAYLGRAWNAAFGAKILPVTIPLQPVANGQGMVLADLAAIFGVPVADPLNLQVSDLSVADLGSPVRLVESGRFRTQVHGIGDEEAVAERAEEVKVQIKSAASEFDEVLAKERLARLTSGLVRITIRAQSSAESREKRDRAEDAVCAVRGALRSGVVPGGSWCLLALQYALRNVKDPIVQQVLIPALRAPFERLTGNIGVDKEAAKAIREDLEKHLGKTKSAVSKAAVFDAMALKVRPVVEAGVWDSVPAVRGSLENALSLAVVLGTLGGAVVFARDQVLDRMEARSQYDFEKALEDKLGPTE